MFSLYIVALASSLLELAKNEKDNEKSKQTIKELDVIISKIQKENKGQFFKTILQLFYLISSLSPI